MSAAATPVAAQLSVNETEVTFRVGDTLTRAALVTVRNESSSPVQAIIKLEDWDRAEDGTNRWYSYGTLPGSCGDALSVFPLSLSLDPGSAQSIRISADPSKPLARECWAAAIVESAVPRTDSMRGINYIVRMATKIYLQPAGLSNRAELIAMDVVPHRPDSASATASRLEVLLANTGGRHLEVSGELQIRRPDNTLAATMQLPTLYTLPGARSRKGVVLPELPKGRYVLLALLDFGGEEIVAGQIEYEVTG